jgi:superfamily II RNA helicase
VANNPGIELELDLYKLIYSFPLDNFQVEGLSHLINGNNVLVSTPTGSGKTVVGELVIKLNYYDLLAIDIIILAAI